MQTAYPTAVTNPRAILGAELSGEMKSAIAYFGATWSNEILR